jgi:hypothetical protein
MAQKQFRDQAGSRDSGPEPGNRLVPSAEEVAESRRVVAEIRQAAMGRAHEEGWAEESDSHDGSGQT